MAIDGLMEIPIKSIRKRLLQVDRVLISFSNKETCSSVNGSGNDFSSTTTYQPVERCFPIHTVLSGLEDKVETLL